MKKKISDKPCLFPERIRELRIEKQMKQKDLALLFGFSANAVSEWENRGKEPSYSTLIKLSKLFGVSIDYLLGNVDFY